MYLIVIVSLCRAQIDVDKLLFELQRDYELIGQRDYLMEKFAVFVSQDKLDEYHVFLDSNGVVNEHIHLSIVHYAYDEKQRIILIEGFSSQGERYYWDFPPITKYRYVSDTIIPYFTYVRQRLYPQSILDTLYDVKIEEEINTKEQSKYNLSRYVVYTKDSTCVFRFSVCSSGRICRKSNNVYFNYRELDSVDKKIIVHERFYDTLFNLVEAPHEYSTYDVSNWYNGIAINYAYSNRKLHDDEYGLYEIWFYNAQGQQVYCINRWLKSVVGSPITLSGRPISRAPTRWESIKGRIMWRR